GRIGSTNYATMDDWQAIHAGLDANSVQVDPAYIDPYSNPYTGNFGLAGLGSPDVILWAIEDIEGNFRTVPPTIGAVELDSSAECVGTPDAGEITGPDYSCLNTNVALSLANSTLEPNITRNWYSSNVSGGPYTTFIGEGFNINTIITEDTWFVV